MRVGQQNCARTVTCSTFFVMRKNGVTVLGVVAVGVLALEVYPRYAAAAFSDGEEAYAHL